MLDGAPASIDLLPAISARIAGRMPILFDSGIRSGHDLFIALALGATAAVLSLGLAFAPAAFAQDGPYVPSQDTKANQKRLKAQSVANS